MRAFGGFCLLVAFVCGALAVIAAATAFISYSLKARLLLELALSWGAGALGVLLFALVGAAVAMWFTRRGGTDAF